MTSHEKTFPPPPPPVNAKTHQFTRFNCLRPRVQHWDVNNEMLHWKYYVYKLNDSSIREWMFRKVREIDPKVKLFLNDYEVVASGLYTQVLQKG
jgi:GH35 family endo-1,4-beta-xylanase